MSKCHGTCRCCSKLEEINKLMIEIYDIGKSSEFASSLTNKQMKNLKEIKELSKLE